MSVRRPEDDRDVIPRWRNPRSTAAVGELAPIRIGTGKPISQAGRLEREHDWLTQKSIGFALDLVGTAIVLGATPPAREAAEAVLATADLSGLPRELARQVLGNRESDEPEIPMSDPTTPEVRTRIKEFRARLKNDPRNGIAWTEMARHYTILGQRNQASHAMRIALGLLPNHRYVLRVAARLAVHHGKFDDAHSMIARSPSTPSDPWLVAAELATAGPADVRPKLVKRGRRMLEDGDFSPRSTSELASALGTLEFRTGSDRKARHLIESSLEAPNDNSIAQGEWISRGLPSLDLDPSLMSESAEARAIRHATAMESEQVLPAAWEWHRDQSFASGPGELGSYHASLVGMYAEGEAIAEASLTANSGEFLLANNLAFCLLNMDKVERASEVLKSIDRNTLGERQLSTYLATCGLLEFRSGNAEEGRALYRQSIKLDRDPHHRTVAMIMLASEELRLHSANADRLVEEAREAGKKFEAEDIRLWLNRLTKRT